MANFFCDSVLGDDGNDGTSWGEAVETISALQALGSSQSHYYLRGNGSSNPYAWGGTDATFRHWHGEGDKDDPTTMPHVVGTGTRGEDGPEDPMYVTLIYFRNFDEAIHDKQSGGGTLDDIVEECWFEDCNKGIDLRAEDDLEVRFCVFFDCTTGIEDRRAGSAQDHLIHHNTFHNCTTGYKNNSDGSAVNVYAAFHSNIFDNCTTGANFEAGGTLTFAAGEPNYNLWNANGTDIVTASQGANKVEDDPDFSDPDNGDFRLLATSPALAAGESGSDIGALGIAEVCIKPVVVDEAGDGIETAGVELTGDDDTIYYQTDFFGGSDSETDANGEVGNVCVDPTNGPFTINLHKYGEYVDVTMIFAVNGGVVPFPIQMRTYGFTVLSEEDAIALTT